MPSIPASLVPVPGLVAIHRFAPWPRILFYGLERLTDRSLREQREMVGGNCPAPWALRISRLSCSIVSFAVGYLLVQRQGTGLRSLALLFLTVASWFIVNDHCLRTEHEHDHHRVGRWPLSGVVVPNRPSGL